MDKLRHIAHRVLYPAIFFLIIFSGCAKKEAIKSVSDEEVLRERVMAYWNHKVREEFDKSYDYEDPLYRKRFTSTKYIKGINTERAVWKQAEISGLKMEGDSATVDMKVRVRIVVTPTGNIEQDAVISERWVKVEGAWYHVPQKFMERKGDN